MGTTLVGKGAADDYTPYLTLTGADDGDGTGNCSIQVKDYAGNNLAQRFKIRAWIAVTEFAVPAAQTAFTLTTGTAMGNNDSANEDYEVVSDASGVVAFDFTPAAAPACSVYVMAEIDGRIWSSGEIAIAVL